MMKREREREKMSELIYNIIVQGSCNCGATKEVKRFIQFIVDLCIV